MGVLEEVKTDIDQVQKFPSLINNRFGTALPETRIILQYLLKNRREITFPNSQRAVIAEETIKSPPAIIQILTDSIFFKGIQVMIHDFECFVEEPNSRLSIG
jgi:hypothetical protein